METTIQKWENSQGIQIPKHMLDELQWSDIEPVDISVDNGHIIICKAKKKLSTLSELCANFKGEYEPIDINFGEPVGNEIW